MFKWLETIRKHPTHQLFRNNDNIVQFWFTVWLDVFYLVFRISIFNPSITKMYKNSDFLIISTQYY